MSRCAVVFLVVLIVCIICLAQGQSSQQRNRCLSQKTCGQCLAAGQPCGWCVQEGYDADNRARCDLVENLVPNGCDESFIINPASEIDYIKKEDPRNAAAGQDPVQISPQIVKVKLRPNKPFKFPVLFRQAENYPVDLYYLMDLSYSMKDDKESLADLGDLLALNMNNITKNFRLGFGSFVDKKTMPYVSTVPEKLISPCDNCAAPYGFRNQLSLTENTKLFRNEVLAAPISGNLDSPEGGFDAIIQAIACKQQIGWRDQSRKMLLFSTDAGFHYAGDGKLGGIVTPNDGQCHLDAQGYYSESLNQDYPSISQVSHKIADNKVNIIFAVTRDQVDVYSKLSSLIEGSTVGELANDSSNVVELVKENYDKISSMIELKTEGAEDISVTFKTKCLGTELRDTAKCDKVGIAQTVMFDVALEVTSCPADRNQWKKTFTIYPVGLTEQLVINLELQCECDCEKPEQEQPNSGKCSGKGTYECGSCTCNDNFYGRTCECDTTSLSSADQDAACRMTNKSAPCEGRGQCLCGICECNPIKPGDPSRRFSGKFCECNDYNCDYFQGELCGGKTRGTCQCGDCRCNAGYTGTRCECPISNESCRAANGEICNGKGVCRCGECECIYDDFYKGKTCEDCPICLGKCEQNKACVQCRAFGSGPLSKENCDANCTHVEVVDHVEAEKDWRYCQFRDDNDCDFFFIYHYKNEKVRAQRTQECAKPVNVLAIVLGVIGGIILIGLLLLLLWKAWAIWKDKREMARFNKERENAKWETEQNPLYKQATSTYKNPMYANKN